ncbi:endonuclease/exonuclease/phosphatase [Bacillus aerolatus]|uniref:Endonuclease/exonuclease/phosphatase n=1 Tax=Bacillus aerolatus TaxID=2653354 RepID=A0A6I1FNF5_9BACI|nr:endonuclease/exonuclease/phosphatase family protein [Bacillus aerolatus]KAB7705575.1 endonuclease/exonuclease/phosphatase [Bacillus aerolatus]
MKNQKKQSKRARLQRIWFILHAALLTATLTGFASNTHAQENTFARGQSTNVKVMSYNIHHAEGEDGVLDLERIARIIGGSDADIIGLQEVDNHWSSRSDFQDQAKMLAERLGLFYVYAANLDLEPVNEGDHRRQYGTAILSKYPIIKSENHLLSKIGSTEQRGLLKATINVKGNHLHVYNTHLALTSAEREMQMKQIIEIANKSKGPKVIMGDLNATPESNEMKPIISGYVDVFANTGSEANTYPADHPSKRIDYIFTSKDIETVNAQVINTLASDHLPLTAEIVLEREAPFYNG